MRNYQFKTVFARTWYALGATIVSSALVVVVLATISHGLFPDVWLAKQTVLRIYIAIPSVLFPLCFVGAPALQARFPIIRRKK